MKYFHHKKKIKLTKIALLVVIIEDEVDTKCRLLKLHNSSTHNDNDNDNDNV